MNQYRFNRVGSGRWLAERREDGSIEIEGFDDEMCVLSDMDAKLLRNVLNAIFDDRVFKDRIPTPQEPPTP